MSNACAATLLASADNKCRFSETASDGFKVNLQLGSFRHWFVIGSGVAQDGWFPNEPAQPKLRQAAGGEGG
jgi:hypothetical protein